MKREYIFLFLIFSVLGGILLVFRFPKQALLFCGYSALIGAGFLMLGMLAYIADELGD